MTNGWPMVPLGDVLNPIRRPERVETGKTYRLLGARWYAGGLYIKDTCDGAEIRADKVYRVERGDFVYNRLFAWKGSFAVADESVSGCYVSNEFPCFHPKPDRIDPQFLRRYMSREPAWAEALGLSTGGTPTSRNRLKEEKLLGMAIPLPPIAKQRQIVALIDALSARIADAINLRHSATEQVTSLVSGVWRSLPLDQWPTASIADVTNRESTISYGVLVPGPEVPDGIPFVRVQDLHPKSPTAFPTKRISSSVEAPYARTRLQGNEILLCVVGATIGKVGIVPAHWKGFNIARAVCRILPSHEMSREFLLAVLQSPIVQQQFTDLTRTLAQPTLNVAQIKATRVPLPPLAEQRRIVAYLDSLSAKAESLKSLQHQSAAELDALLPSILDRAFAGAL